MTRSILVVIAAGAFVSMVAGSVCSTGGGVGDPCIPEEEYDPCFQGFSINVVSAETKSFQCLTRVCLVNHFQGRVSCPYGQNAGTASLTGPPNNCAAGTLPGGPPFSSYYGASTGGDGGTSAGDGGTTAAGGATALCDIPGGATVLGTSNPLDISSSITQVQVPVLPQVLTRNTNNAVYCSCRCENENGQTNDGAVYCQCPDGFSCTQLVASIGGNLNTGLEGGYCMKNGTGYNPIANADCMNGGCCEPGINPCQ
jgi:hypothetical protein